MWPFPPKFVGELETRAWVEQDIANSMAWGRIYGPIIAKASKGQPSGSYYDSADGLIHRPDGTTVSLAIPQGPVRYDQNGKLIPGYLPGVPTNGSVDMTGLSLPADDFFSSANETVSSAMANSQVDPATSESALETEPTPPSATLEYVPLAAHSVGETSGVLLATVSIILLAIGNGLLRLRRKFMVRRAAQQP
jgi:hypothetical protein